MCGWQLFRLLVCDIRRSATIWRGFTRGRVCTRSEEGLNPEKDKREPILAIWFSSITYIFKNLCLHDDDDDDDDDDEEVLMHAGQLRPKLEYICMIHMRYYILVSLKY